MQHEVASHSSSEEDTEDSNVDQPSLPSSEEGESDQRNISDVATDSDISLDLQGVRTMPHTDSASTDEYDDHSEARECAMICHDTV